MKNPAPAYSFQTENKSCSQAGVESWKQLTRAPGPAPTHCFPVTAAGKINTAALWTLPYHVRELQYCLHGEKWGREAGSCGRGCYLPILHCPCQGGSSPEGVTEEPSVPLKGKFSRSKCCHSAPRTATPGKVRAAKS